MHFRNKGADYCLSFFDQRIVNNKVVQPVHNDNSGMDVIIQGSDGGCRLFGKYPL